MYDSKAEKSYLLVYVTIGRTPTEDLVIAAYSVHSRLRIDREESKRIHS